MKCLSLWQPWASLIATGWKTVETRDWYTSYRGPLAIHAATKRDLGGKLLHLAHPEMFTSGWENHPANVNLLTLPTYVPFPFLPFGAIVATCTVAACLPTAMVADIVSKLKPPFTPAHGWDVERRLGNYEAGRWAWILRDVQPLARPIPFAGKRKLFEIPWSGPKALHSLDVRAMPASGGAAAAAGETSSNG